MKPTIAVDGDNFQLTLPGVDTKDTHTVLIPLRAPELLIRILSKWQEASGPHRKIGHDASPTQYMVEGWLKANESRVDVRAERERAQARIAAIEAKYPGFDLSEIEI